MAKDVLAVLITGVGVLHMFSITQRICSYQRYRSGVEIMKRMIIVQHCECIAEEEELDDQRTAETQGAGGEEEMVPSFLDADFHTAEQHAISHVDNEEDNDNNEDQDG